MGTLVTIHVVRDGGDADEAICRAFEWFHAIEERCTRFDERSELRRLTAKAGHPVQVSAILYEAVKFALLVAEETGLPVHLADDPMSAVAEGTGRVLQEIEFLKRVATNAKY